MMTLKEMKLLISSGAMMTLKEMREEGEDKQASQKLRQMIKECDYANKGMESQQLPELVRGIGWVILAEHEFSSLSNVAFRNSDALIVEIRDQ